MKKSFSKILTVLLAVCMLAGAFVFPTAAATDYAAADDGDLLYEVNFNGDNVFKNPKGSWAGDSVTKTQASVVMSIKKDNDGKNRGSAWGADLQDYIILGRAYTTVFTLSASDADEEIGFLPDDWAGFVLTPGQNAYRFITTKKDGKGTDGAYEKKIASGTYDGTGELTQTYAVEFKTSGSVANPKVDAYNLYVQKDGGWVLVCSLDAEQRNKDYFDWFYYDGGVYEQDFTMRFYRRGYVLGSNGNTTSTLDTTQNGTVTVSGAKVYKGLLGSSNIYYQFGNDGSKIRIVGVVDFADKDLSKYSELGFNVVTSLDGVKQTKKLTTQLLHKSIMAGGKTINASDYGGTYFYVAEYGDLDRTAASEIIIDIDCIAVLADGTVENIYKGKRIEFMEKPLTALPAFTGYSYTDIDKGDNCYMRSFGKVDKTAFESYCASIAANGFTLYAEKNIEANIYKTYVNDKYVVTTIYTKHNGYGKVLAEPLSSTALPTKAEDNVYTPVADCTTTITQVGLFDGNANSTYNGMCYVIRLADGSFIVVDGGFDRTGYPERIYNVLKKQAPDPDKIVIAAWIITHAHDDHVDVFESFFKSYGDKLTVERFICNFPAIEQLKDNWANEREGNENYVKMMREFLYTSFPNVPIVKAHPGQEFNLRNAKINILYTVDVYDKKLDDFNNTSVVFKLEAEGKSMLFLGDYDDKGDIMSKLYTADTLKSDLMQVAHHGLPENSSNKVLAEKIAPTYAFLPAGAQVVKNGSVDLFAITENQYLVNNCEILLAEDNVYVFNMKDFTYKKYDTVAAYLAS